MPSTVLLTVGTLQQNNTHDVVYEIGGGTSWVVILGTAIAAGISVGDVMVQTSGVGQNNYWRIVTVGEGYPPYGPGSYVEVTDAFGAGAGGPEDSETCTLGRMFTTLGTAEAAIATFCGSGDTCRMELYADGVISEASVTFNDATLTSTGTLEVVAAAGQEHRGWSGEGVIWQPTNTTGVFMYFSIAIANDPTKLLEGIEINGNGVTLTNGAQVVVTSLANSTATFNINRIIFRNWDNSGSKTMTGVHINAAGVTVENCLFDALNVKGTGIRTAAAVAVEIRNCTVASWGSIGYYAVDGATIKARGCAAFNGGTCFVAAFGGSWHGDSDYNASADATAPGANSLQSQTAADHFVAPAATPPDLRLLATSTMRRLGPNDITTDRLDITGRARRYPWDIGAYGFRRQHAKGPHGPIRPRERELELAVRE